MKKYLWLILLLFSINWGTFSYQTVRTNPFRKLSYTKKELSFLNRKLEYMENHKGSKAVKENLDVKAIYYTTLYWAKFYHIDVDIIIALEIRESNLAQRPKDSSASCRGMCQISKDALSDFNVYLWKREKKVYTWEEMYEYDKNIQVACYYLNWLWNNFDNITTAKELLQAYNVGPYNLNENKVSNDFRYANFIVERVKEIKSLEDKI